MFYQFNTPEMLFVAKAVLKKDATRPQMEMVYSTGEEIVATDGHRLHRYKPDICPLPAGYYEIKKHTKKVLELLKVETDLQYPEYERIMPDRARALPFPTRREGGTQISTAGKYAEVVRAMGAGALNYKFFEDANTVTMCSYHAPDATSPVLLVGLNITAVIMPMLYL